MEGLALFNRLLGEAIIKWTDKIIKNEPFSNQGMLCPQQVRGRAVKQDFQLWVVRTVVINLWCDVCMNCLRHIRSLSAGSHWIHSNLRTAHHGDLQVSFVVHWLLPVGLDVYECSHFSHSKIGLTSLGLLILLYLLFKTCSYPGYSWRY